MYEAYWRLNAKPFENTPEADFYWPGESHQGALLKLRYAIENRRGAALLTGAAGLGKTLLVQTLLRGLPDDCSPAAHLVFPQMAPGELLAYLADELTGERTGGAPSVHTSIQRLRDALGAAAEAGKHPIVAIDEAHLLRESGALETVRLLLNFEERQQPALTLLLVGQSSLLPTLERMPGLDERLAVKCLLRRLTLDETASYVQHRLQAAGAEQAIFEDDALEAIHGLTHGIPRRINRLGDLALLIGYAEEQPSIRAAQVESIAEELVAVAPE